LHFLLDTEMMSFE